MIMFNKKGGGYALDLLNLKVLESTNRGAISSMLSLLPLEFRSQKSAFENRSWFRFEDICDEGLTLRHLAHLSHREWNEQRKPHILSSAESLRALDLVGTLWPFSLFGPPPPTSPQIVIGHEENDPGLMWWAWAVVWQRRSDLVLISEFRLRSAVWFPSS